jgi:hypothetical protein
MIQPSANIKVLDSKKINNFSVKISLLNVSIRKLGTKNYKFFQDGGQTRGHT